MDQIKNLYRVHLWPPYTSMTLPLETYKSGDIHDKIILEISRNLIY